MIWFGWLLCHWSSFPTVQFSYNSWTTHFLSVATGLEFDIDFSNFTELLFARFQRLLRSADVHCRHLLLDLRRRSLFQGKENLCHFLFRVCCVVCSLCVNWKFLARPIQPQRISKNLEQSQRISNNLNESVRIPKNLLLWSSVTGSLDESVANIQRIPTIERVIDLLLILEPKEPVAVSKEFERFWTLVAVIPLLSPIWFHYQSNSAIIPENPIKSSVSFWCVDCEIDGLHVWFFSVLSPPLPSPWFGGIFQVRGGFLNDGDYTTTPLINKSSESTLVSRSCLSSSASTSSTASASRDKNQPEEDKDVTVRLMKEEACTFWSLFFFSTLFLFSLSLFGFSVWSFCLVSLSGLSLGFVLGPIALVLWYYFETQ